MVAISLPLNHISSFTEKYKNLYPLNESKFFCKSNLFCGVSISLVLLNKFNASLQVFDFPLFRIEINSFSSI